MKFEQLLQIYWAKGFLCGGSIEPFDTTIGTLFNNLFGVSVASKKVFIRRFEANYLISFKTITFLDLDKKQRKPMNIYFSRIMSVNHSLLEIYKLNLLRLYLTKTYRGRCQAIGKPSRGQRTWSNASNAYNCNVITRDFISKIKSAVNKDKKPEKINYRTVKKIFKKKSSRPKVKVVKKTANVWF